MSKLGVYDQRVLDGTVEVVYTVTADTTFVFKTHSFCNTANQEQNVTMWVVPEGQEVADSYLVFKNLKINANDTVIFNPDIYMQAGYKLVLQAGEAGTLTSLVSGVVM